MKDVTPPDLTAKKTGFPMMPPIARLESSPQLPASADYVIIGGGIIGVFTAYYLAKRGAKVCLIEKGLIGAEQSSRNWGWCRQQNRDERELPLASKSIDLWERFAAESGENAGFERTGLLYLSNDEAEIAQWARWGEFARTMGVETHMLSSAQATERGRFSGKQWRGGVFAPTDGIANPAEAAPAVARAIIKLGGTVHQNCAARGLETTGGRVSGVVTETGVVHTNVAILSAGAWASSFCHQYGLRFPQSSARQSVMLIGSGPGELPDALHTAGISITRRGHSGHLLSISGRARIDLTPQKIRFAKDFVPMFFKRRKNLALGGWEGMRGSHETLGKWALDKVTPMERMRILEPKPDATALQLTHDRAIDMVPTLRERTVTARFAGFIDSTPDSVPGIGEFAALPGLVLAAGFSGHGFGIGPGAGHLIADMVSGATPIVDPASYHPSRFDSSQRIRVADY
jgi:glycine/D-amino acid oxidase-like deaminating enzyme